ncbi:MAG: sodium-translocating pyrophosphatase [bacterium]|nr:sodium-translocating pyrophosphatase [bacterium]
MIIVLAFSIGGLLFAVWLAKWVMSQEMGEERMRKISESIKEGAEAFLKRQNTTIAQLAAILGIVLFVMYAFVRKSQPFDPVESRIAFGIAIGGSFLFGATCSVVAGYIGMWVSIRTNIRVATAAMTSLNRALQIALRGGAVSGLFVVAVSLLGVGLLYSIIDLSGITQPERIPLLIVGYGFGASFVALFAQLGGGIYTKAADVGADLVGKVEAGIPEDDPRNPAVIADLVGDNVGDCAGRGADLFESTAAENIGAMILGATLAMAAKQAGVGFAMGTIGVMMFPLIARAFGILAAIIGVMIVKTPEDGDPMAALNKGYGVAVVLAMIFFGFTTKWLLSVPNAPQAWWHFFLCGIIGVLMSVAFVWITQYYTEYKYRPVKEIAEAATTGPATVIISGIAVGFECTAMPVLVMGVSIIASYYLGRSAFPPDAIGQGVNAGLFGTGVATMGMLATAAYILAMDTFGPISDNAGGIIEMSEQPKEVRVKTDRLDAVGNTTKALTKGYAIGSAALAAFLLFSAYMDEVRLYAGREGQPWPINLAKPEVFVGALLGAMLVFLFSSLAIRAVGKAAKMVIEEVRRQFASLPRVNDMIQFPADFKPDYRTCVDLVTKSALREMVAPGLLATLMPIGVGILFRMFITQDDPMIAAESVAALLMVGTITGILMATFLNNGGGAWDNAKKYIEAGAYGGKYIKDANGNEIKNPTHSAAVVGDTVGDPFKDTAGPSIHVLIKLLSTVTLVLAPLFI